MMVDITEFPIIDEQGDKMRNHCDAIENFIKTVPWHKLNKVYGNSHSAVIGLIALEWIGEKGNSVFEACPGYQGKYPDILLNKNDEVFAVVEVETSVKKYIEKLNNLEEFYHGYQGTKVAVLIALNDNYGDKNNDLYTHYWDKNSFHSAWGTTNMHRRISELKMPLLIVSIEKKKAESLEGYLGKLRSKHNFKYEVCNIEYRIYNSGIIQSQGILWSE